MPGPLGDLPHRIALEVRAEAVRLVMKDAGLYKDDVDGLINPALFGPRGVA